MGIPYRPPPLPGARRLIPEGYPVWRQVDNLIHYERWRNAGNFGVQGAQVQAFMLLRKLHAYIGEARRELETALGVTLCREHCCCTRSTPFITRLEAEYIISSNGYYSDLIRIAEEWLLAPHPEAPTYPAELPSALGGPVQHSPQVVAEMRALAGLRSPYLLAGSAHRGRFSIGPFVRSFFTAEEHWDLLEDTQPLTCAVSGVFVAPPPWCRRRLGLGESEDTRVLAAAGTIREGYGHLEQVYRQYPDKAHYGLLPTMVLRVANPTRFERLVKEGRVALAKIGVNRTGRFPFKLWEDSYVGTAQASLKVTSPGTGLNRSGAPLRPA